MNALDAPTEVTAKQNESSSATMMITPESKHTTVGSADAKLKDGNDSTAVTKRKALQRFRHQEEPKAKRKGWRKSARLQTDSIK